VSNVIVEDENDLVQEVAVTRPARIFSQQ